ncbi:MAG: hypothetical protein IJ462_04135 [Clostridia bacterium]|nr:hypothetical protein [Clostridia bacterium]
MILTKKISALFLAIIICVMSVFTVSAANRKDSISNYAKKGSLTYKEELLCGFDDSSLLSQMADSYTFDSKDKKEGQASYAASFSGTDRKNVFSIINFGKTINMKKAENSLVTLKLWVYISDASQVKADHEDLYNEDYSKTSTMFFRITSHGTQHNSLSLNPTVWESGWQEIELDVSLNYGKTDGFNAEYVTGIYMFIYGKGPVTIKLDDLRVCYYSNTGYKADTSDIIEGARIVSTCDYDALDGVLVNEWFDSKFSEDVKHSGSSSVHSFADGSDDQRLYFSNNSIPLDRNKDYLCFWMYIDDFSNLGNLFIEANENQDIHEYEITNFIAQMPVFAKTSQLSGNWFMMQIPIKSMKERLGQGYSNTITLRALRMAITPRKGKEVNVYVDSVFIATQEQVFAYNNAQNNEEASSSTTQLKPSSSAVSSSNVSSEATENSNTILYIAIIGGAVLVLAIFAVVAIVVIKKSKKRG